MKKIISLFLILSLVIIACSKKTTSSKTVTTTTTTTAPAIEIPKPANTTDMAMVAEGKNVYEGKCGRCHGLKNTGDYTAERWDGILRSMVPKAKLNDMETQQVTAYVKANAKK